MPTSAHAVKPKSSSRLALGVLALAVILISNLSTARLARAADDGAIGGAIYIDDNANSRRDSGEAAVEGVEITLSQNGSVKDTVTTSKLGVFSFRHLDYAEYELAITSWPSNVEPISSAKQTLKLTAEQDPLTLYVAMRSKDGEPKTTTTSEATRDSRASSTSSASPSSPSPSSAQTTTTLGDRTTTTNETPVPETTTTTEVAALGSTGSASAALGVIGMAVLAMGSVVALEYRRRSSIS